MAENKKSFLLYCDIIHTVSKLPDDKAGQLFKHILDYVNDKEPYTDDLIIQLAFEPIKQALKRDLRKYEEIRRKRSEAGKASANKRQQMSTSVESDQQVSTVNDIVIVSVNDNDIKKDNTSSSDDEADTYLTKKKRRLSGKRLDTFNMFWERFNYKKGKAEAADAWMDIPQLTNSLCLKIYAAAENEATLRKNIIAAGKTPIMAQGWITGRRWEDDYTINEYEKNRTTNGRGFKSDTTRQTIESLQHQFNEIE